MLKCLLAGFLADSVNVDWEWMKLIAYIVLEWV